MKRLPIGISDFKKLIENNYIFADTTRLIGDFYREAADILLITRPRRFGKTLNMSMLAYFFDNRLETGKLFEGFEVIKDTEVMKALNGYPVIFLSFKDIKNNTWDNSLSNIKWLISKLYQEKEKELAPILTSNVDKDYYKSIVERTATEVDYQNSLKNLIDYLEKAYSKKVILIIDEYDVPIQSGWHYGYYDDIINFMRVFLSAALKDNPALFKGILTGIYRVAKESIFSGLNNLKVYTVMDERYSTYFGFTKENLAYLLKYLNLEKKEEIKQALIEWYNGYKFGENVIYNPWSVINYLYDKKLQPYWVNTSSNDLIITLIEKNMHQGERFREAIEKLISGETIKKTIDDASALREIETDPESIWTLFLFSGYLTIVEKAEEQYGVDEKYNCRIPNREVTRFFRKTVLQWLKKANRVTIDTMAEKLLMGDGEAFCKSLKEYVTGTLSYFDIEKKPENTYHMLLLGIFAQLQDMYLIKSNRETGLGRADILLKANDKSHYSAVIEIKAGTDKKTVEEAMKQIEEKDYIRELEQEGYSKILKVAIGVDGKIVETMVFK